MIIGLVVKNEAESIAETIATLRTITDGRRPRIVVFDTGSTDETIAQAQAADAEVYTDLAWPESGRYDEAYNAMLERLEAMAADPTEWIMHAYGRRLYEGTWTPPEGASIVTSTEFWSEHCHATRIVAYRAGLCLRYQGSTHEVLMRPPHIEVPDSGVRMRRHACAHPRPERWERDLALLEDDMSPRGRFYYAQTLACLANAAHDAGDRERANFLARQAYDAYLKRADMEGEGDDSEVVVSLFRATAMMPWHRALLPAATRRCHGALAIDENRGEPWLVLAEFCFGIGDAERAGRYALMARCATPDPRSLFLDPTVPARADRLLAHVAELVGVAPAA